MALDAEGFVSEEHQLLRSADLRYDGQAFEVRVDAPGGRVDAAFQQAVVAAFHDEHERLYGYSYRDVASRGGHEHPVEWVNLRVTGIGPIRRPTIPTLADGPTDPAASRTSTRPVVFEDGPTETSIHDRARLAPGTVIDGPAVIEEFGSTVPIHPGFRAEVDVRGNLVVRRVDVVRMEEQR